MSMDKPCIAFTGGGTGGHVYPGLAIIERLRERWDGRIVWIGSGKAVERDAVRAAGIEFYSVPSGKLRRSLSPRNLVDVFKVAAGYVAARSTLRALRPLILFSKGGYVSVPPCLAAHRLGIPVFTHESDVSPGLATRLNSRWAERIVLSWEASLAFLDDARKKRAVVMGNPVRSAVGSGNAGRGKAWLGVKPDLPLVLVMGGSQGAREVNDLVAGALPLLGGSVAFAHQLGAGNPPAAPNGPTYRSFEFVHGELPDLYAAADIVVGRAGAGIVWESSAAGKPMILVPLVKGSRGDQVENARLLSDAGGAITLTGADATAERLAGEIRQLATDPNKRAHMARAAAAVAPPDAASAIANLILERAAARLAQTGEDAR